MHLALYRSVTHLTYPDESFTYQYAFEPIPAEELCRDGRLACWTDESGTVPFPTALRSPRPRTDGSCSSLTRPPGSMPSPSTSWPLTAHWACCSSRGLDPTIGDTSGEPLELKSIDKQGLQTLNHESAVTGPRHPPGRSRRAGRPHRARNGLDGSLGPGSRHRSSSQRQENGGPGQTGG
jgi:hypothetical protein